MMAADVIGKGLDPTHPHSVIGHDGMIAVPTSVMEAAQPLTVIAISAPEEPPASVEEPAPEVLAPTEEPKKVEEEAPPVLPSQSEEKAPEETPVVTEESPVVETPKKSGKAPKAPKA